MIGRATGPQSRREAPALRFLLLCLGGWVAMRALMNWGPVVPPPPEAVRPPPTVSAPAAVAVSSAALMPPATARLVAPAVLRRGMVPVRAARHAAKATGVIGGKDVAAQFAFPVATPLRDAAAAGTSLRETPAIADIPTPARGSLAGWSLGGWLYLRGEAGADTLAAGGQIGGSQAGARLAYGFGESGRTQAYGRATVAVRRPRQRELAFGIAHAPVAGLPVDVAVERRVAIGREGRGAFAAMAVGGVSDIALPAGFRLDAYAQAGIVGARRRDGFADGAIVADRSLNGGALRLGALASGAVQPGAARVDIGPRLTLGLPHVGHGARLTLDWRQRVAGGARPESGPALTLAADF